MQKISSDNVSTLFSSLGTQSSSINLADYAAIKNGSYGKLMKAYYNEMKSSSSSASSDKTEKTKTTADDKTLTKVKTRADALSESVSELTSSELWKSENGSLNKEKITSAVKDFASDYNNLVSQVSSSSSSEVKEAAGWMTSMTDTMKNALSKVGVTVGTDYKLTVDSEKLASASEKEVKALFSGKTSYAGQIGTKAEAVSKAALSSSGIYGSDATYSNALSSLFQSYV